MLRKILFLDRDGTLMVDVGYPRDPAMVTLLPGAAEGVATLAAAGFWPVVVSNQSGLGRGLITPTEALAVHARFANLMEQQSGWRLPMYYCPHAPEEGCRCRKPGTGMLNQAMIEHRGEAAIMIGDKPSDVATGRAVGAFTVLLSDQGEADLVQPTWSGLATKILNAMKSHTRRESA
ncbi:MAG: D-glycero-alpha-D-manno-heptose-1,7-bisphosphate 7-phosphatase [Gemmataceae bacterium]